MLDVTHFLAGPYVSMLLADMGAEVIKVERPEGDESRKIAPIISDVIGTCFLASNRNKKGITLNLATAEGADIFKRLVKVSDVVVENFRPGTFARLGISYDELSRVNPGIIMTSVSGFGQYGPYSHRTALDIVAQAMGGLMSYTGYPDGPPTRTGNAMGDFLGGLFGAYGTLAALHYRERTGKGQWVDSSMHDAVVAVLENAVTNYMALGEVWQRDGSRTRGNAPYNAYEAKDGWLVIGVTGNVLWARFAKAMGREELASDPGFGSDTARRQNVNLVDEVVSGWVKTHTVAEVIAICDEAGVPCGPVLSVDQVPDDPQVKARRMVEKVDYPGAGPVWLSGVCPKLSATPGAVYAPPPTLGQHNEEVYGKLLGFDRNYIKDLHDRKVI